VPDVSVSSPDGSLVRARPYKLEVPPTDAGAGAMPLVILIHGYGSSGAGHDSYLGLSKLTKARGVLLAIPNGTRDHTGKLFWNATDACCDFDNAPVDDVAYLDAIIADVSSKQVVDPKRVYIIGHSNGAFMAHRYACDRSDRVAAIVALAGVPWSDVAKCTGKNVSVLQVHGDADTIIDYGGGKSFGNGMPYPGAEGAVTAWATRDGCKLTRHASAPIDLVGDVPGAETTRESYECPEGIDVALWRMHGVGHVPGFDARFSNGALDFLLAHHR
jgi:polyhydroxybutyrate depolymerase